MAKKPKRVVFRVTRAKDGKWLWELIRTCRGGWGFRYLYYGKSNAVAEGRLYAKYEHAAGRLAQLVVHGKDGKIQYENTYGRDPKRYVG